MENTTNTTQTNKYNPQEFVELADKTYLTFIKEGRYKEIISSMSGLGDYSLRNQMLILHQCPTATKVNTMSGWNFNKRNITKGSQSIKILAPVFNSVVTSNNGNIVESKSEAITGYKINYVFDISQTESRNLDTAQKDTDTNYEPYYWNIIKGLQGSLKSYTFLSDTIDSDAILDTRQRTITLKSGLTEKQYLHALVDQIAAALVLGRDRSKFQGLKSDELPNVNAVEISAVSKIVSQQLGFEAQNIIEPNFAELSENNIEKFAQNIGVVRSVSQRMMSFIYNAFEEAKTQQKIALEKGLEQITHKTEVETAKTVSQTKTKTKTKAQAEMG